MKGWAAWAAFAILLPGVWALSTGGAGGATSPEPTHRPWWSHAVIYEIYPRSFGDANGDGVGDLNGITAHLPYLKRLGVDAIWLAPIYPSPQVDFGYDISNYVAVDPRFGSLHDLGRLQSAAQHDGIRVILDLVLNHTSDRHAWFEESAASRSNPKADWYIWNDGVAADRPGLSPVQRRYAVGGVAPPNNWTSQFGGSAWQWVPARRQFYYHQFYRQQPDLNWRNPAVEAAMMEVMRFWLDRGIAGFRLDAVTSLFEDAKLRNEPEAGGMDAFGNPRLRHIYTDNLPEEHAVIRRLRALIDRYPGDRVLIGETWLADTAAMRNWYGGVAMDELQLPMDMMLGFGGARYTADWFRPRLKAAQDDLGGAPPLLVFDNHDSRRSIDRFGDGVHDAAIAKGIAAILYLSRGTALTYYGAEIGMRTRTPERREDVRDPIGIAGWPSEKGRDGERTPMQWTSASRSGFTTARRPWLPINPDHIAVNVADEQQDRGSILRWNETLMALRQGDAALRDGSMTVLDRTEPGVLEWRRDLPGGTRSVLVAINMTDRPKTTALGAYAGARTLAASDAGIAMAADALVLPPYAVWVGGR